MELLIIIAFAFVGLKWLINELAEESLKAKIKKARKMGDMVEYHRLSLLLEQHRRRREHSVSGSDDQKYIDAMFTLDAAEQGYFWPGGERVFDNLDDPYSQAYNDEDAEY